jgi:hypothetical protein
MFRRILLVMSAAALVAAMLAVSALPALAVNPNAAPVDFNAPPQYAPVGPPTHSATNPETIIVVHCGGFGPNTQGARISRDQGETFSGECQEPPSKEGPLIVPGEGPVSTH